jgi:hypothetical protein
MKKWSLLILFPLLLILIGLLTLTLAFRSKPIENETIGTEYSFQNLQFNMVSNDFKLLEEAYEEFVELGEENVIVYEDSSGRRMIIMKGKNINLFKEKVKFFTNPLYIAYLEIFTSEDISRYSELADENENFRSFAAKVYESETKLIIYKFSETEERVIMHTIDVLQNNTLYSILLYGGNLKSDAYEIIRSVNIKE